MQKILFFLLFFSFYTYAKPVMQVTDDACQTLVCVREHIDSIDQQLISLITKRLDYVKQAGEIKGSKVAVYDPTREAIILRKVGIETEKQGYPASIMQEIFKTILKQSREYETKHAYHS